MKILQILFWVLCANSLFAQEVFPPNSNFILASVRPCPFDTTQSFVPFCG